MSSSSLCLGARTEPHSTKNAFVLNDLSLLTSMCKPNTYVEKRGGGAEVAGKIKKQEGIRWIGRSSRGACIADVTSPRGVMLWCE